MKEKAQFLVVFLLSAAFTTLSFRACGVERDRDHARRVAEYYRSRHHACADDKAGDHLEACFSWTKVCKAHHADMLVFTFYHAAQSTWADNRHVGMLLEEKIDAWVDSILR